MTTKKPDLYRSLARHFSALNRLPISVVDAAEHEIRFTEDAAGTFFCDICPNRCNLLPTMLYGCSEARRWKGRYIYYCPIGLVFSAVTVPESDLTVLAGPVVMGELQDTLLDMPDYIDKEKMRELPLCLADTMNHVTSLLEMAVYGLRYRPDTPYYDKNIISEIPVEDTENAEEYNSFPMMGDLEEEFGKALTDQDKMKARKILNEFLGYVYAPHPDQFALIRSRAVRLVWLLLKHSGEVKQDELFLYRQSYIPAVRGTQSLEELDLLLTEVLHHFVEYSFEFSKVRHSDTIYRVMEYIKSNFNRKLTLEEISSYVYLSPSHLSGMFRKEIGQTISTYITYIRIEKSKILLTQKGVKVADIAELCGFEDQGYFTRVFRKHVGISPRQYRENAFGGKASAE